MKNHIKYEMKCDELKIQNTIAVSKEAFLIGESEETTSHLEFLYQQSKYIKKHWWAMQGLLLACVCFLLYGAETDYLIRRSLGLAAPLFVVLILPELWKNRSNDAMEVECTTFYTLRSIYSARLTLFAGVDVLLLSAFFMGASLVAKVTLWEMLIQFMLPFNVTCCICFRCLYSKVFNTEALSLLLCCFWIVLWTLVILNDAVYYKISIPMWVGLLTASFLYMGYTLCRGQKLWQNTLEVKPQWS